MKNIRMIISVLYMFFIFCGCDNEYITEVEKVARDTVVYELRVNFEDFKSQDGKTTRAVSNGMFTEMRTGDYIGILYTDKSHPLRYIRMKETLSIMNYSGGVYDIKSVFPVFCERFFSDNEGLTAIFPVNNNTMDNITGSTLMDINNHIFHGGDNFLWYSNQSTMQWFIDQDICTGEVVFNKYNYDNDLHRYYYIDINFRHMRSLFIAYGNISGINWNGLQPFVFEGRAHIILLPNRNYVINGVTYNLKPGEVKCVKF